MGKGGVQDPQEGTPGSASETGQPTQRQGGEQGSGNGLSREEIRAIVEEVLDVKLQSFKDRRFAKLEAAISELKQQGVPTEEIAGVLRAQQAGGPRQAAPSQTAAQRVGGASQEQDGEVTPIMSAALSVMEKADTWIDDDDPELKLIDYEKADEQPVVFFQQLQAAIEAKKQRQQAGDPARMPGLTGGAAATGGGKAALTKELGELLEHPSANMLRIREVREQLKKYN